MTGYVLCACCKQPIPVSADDVGLTVTCPRTRQLIPVKQADVLRGANPPAASPAASTPKPPPVPTRKVLPRSSPLPSPTPAPQSAPCAEQARSRRWPRITACALGLLVLVGISVFAGRSIRPTRNGNEAVATSRPADQESGKIGQTVPALPTPVVPPPGTGTTTLPAPLVPPPGGVPVVPPPLPARALPDSLRQVAATYRREVVRVNHPRNCVMCHAPSFQEADLVRGAVPDQTQPLPPPTTPAYYTMGGQFVGGDTTYLRQDFSLVQPVLNAGKWSTHQRFDYFVTIRKTDQAPATNPAPDSPYRKAVGFALRELSDRDPDRDADWLTGQKRSAVSLPDTRLAEVSQSVSLQTDPKALIAIKAREFSQPLLAVANDELEKLIKGLQDTYGTTATRTALVAYLDPLTRTGDAGMRAKAARLLAIVLSDALDADLPRAFRAAATAASLPPADPARLPLGAADRGPAPPAPPKDPRGLAIHSLRKRIDTRDTAAVEKELLGVREVHLNPEPGTDASGDLVKLAEKRRASGDAYPGTVIACDGRADLAGLPFRIGLDATLTKEKAEALHALSKSMRETVQSCMRRDDPRPNTDDLYAALIPPDGGSVRPGRFGGHDPKKWTLPEAVPCIQQILSAENRDVRRLACELLRRIDTAESTEALVRWAVFETDPSNRAAAVEALRTRGRHHVAEQLLQYVRYPWPRAVEHAVEALVALNCKEAIPQLAVMYDQPDPDAPFSVVSGIPAPAPGAGVVPPRPDPAPVVPPVAVAMKPDVVIANAGVAVVASAFRAAEESALDAHSKAAKDPDPKVRRAAAEGLASFLTNPNEVIRRKVAQTLAELGADAEPATATLREAVKDPDGDVRKSARLALEKIDEAAANAKAVKTREAILALAKDLKAKEPATRIKALGQIAAYGPEANIVGEQLIEAMVDKVSAVQVAASEALEKVNPQVYPHVFTILRGEAKEAAIVKLGELGEGADITVPLLLYSHFNRSVLGINSTSVFPAIAKIAPKDKRFASAVLAAIAAPIPATDGRNFRNVEALCVLRRSAFAQLDTINAERGDKVKALMMAIGDGQEATSLITTLGSYGKDAEPALPMLKKLKLSPNDTLRKAATEAIAKIE